MFNKRLMLKWNKKGFMWRISKKGQIEDFFSDLIPAIIIVVIALVIISVVDAKHDNSVRVAFESDMARMSASDLNTLMRSPSILEGYDNMGEVFVLLSEAVNDREKYEWLWDGKMLKGDDTVFCDDKLFNYLDDYFAGYYSWNILTLDIRCFRLGERTVTPYSTVPEDIATAVMDAELLLPTNNPLKPVRVSFKGWWEYE